MKKYKSRCLIRCWHRFTTTVGVVVMVLSDLQVSGFNPQVSPQLSSNDLPGQMISENMMSAQSVLNLNKQCPQMPSPTTEDNFDYLCHMKSCMRDEDCHNHGRHGDFICCFNGCIHSCLPANSPPIVIDWIDEPEVHKTKPRVFIANDNITSSVKTLISGEIQTPGGCFLSEDQYEDLALFRKYEHVSACSCFLGEIQCRVKTDEVR